MVFLSLVSSVGWSLFRVSIRRMHALRASKARGNFYLLSESSASATQKIEISNNKMLKCLLKRMLYSVFKDACDKIKF